MIPLNKPFEIFAEWLGEAKNSGMSEPTAFNLATVGADGKPSSRMVLLKIFDEHGFVFFTNSKSRKGNELSKNQNVAACFYWMELNKQVRVEGKVEEVKGKEADEYFQSRATISKLGAWASEQSQILPDRKILLEKVEKFREKYGENPPRPPHWYGYRIVPERFEFWQEIDFRLHDREVFERRISGWKNFKLYP